MKIPFKTISPYFEKERDGLKCDTVRKVRDTDSKFNDLMSLIQSNKPGEVVITNPATKEQFERKITDVTYFDDRFIISWKHGVSSTNSVPESFTKEELFRMNLTKTICDWLSGGVSGDHSMKIIEDLDVKDLSNDECKDDTQDVLCANCGKLDYNHLNKDGIRSSKGIYCDIKSMSKFTPQNKNAPEERFKDKLLRILNKMLEESKELKYDFTEEEANWQKAQNLELENIINIINDLDESNQILKPTNEVKVSNQNKSEGDKNEQRR